MGFYYRAVDSKNWREGFSQGIRNCFSSMKDSFMYGGSGAIIFGGFMSIFSRYGRMSKLATKKDINKNLTPKRRLFGLLSKRAKINETGQQYLREQAALKNNAITRGDLKIAQRIKNAPPSDKIVRKYNYGLLSSDVTPEHQQLVQKALKASPVQANQTQGSVRSIPTSISPKNLTNDKPSTRSKPQMKKSTPKDKKLIVGDTSGKGILGWLDKAIFRKLKVKEFLVASQLFMSGFTPTNRVNNSIPDSRPAITKTIDNVEGSGRSFEIPKTNSSVNKKMASKEVNEVLKAKNTSSSENSAPTKSQESKHLTLKGEAYSE